MRDESDRIRSPRWRDVNAIRRAYREEARRCRSKHDDAVGHVGSWHVAFEVSDPQRRIGSTSPDSRPLGAGEDDAFTNEVDVDFPSVSRFVERMRRSFFGASSKDPVSAEVRLTPFQARTGVRVPLDVSLRHTCPVCGGRGEVWLDRCGACDGRGAGLLPHQLQLMVPPGVRHGTRLRFDVTPPYAPTARVQVLISIQ